MNILRKEIDQNWQNETIKYWFTVNGEYFCIADNCGELTLLDFEGYPIDACNDQEGVKDSLIPEYELWAEEA